MEESETQPEMPGLPPTLQICHRSGAWIRDWLSAQVPASQHLELPFDADIRKCHIKLVFQQICLTSDVFSWYPLASVFFLSSSCSFSSIPVNQFYCCLMLSLGDPRLHSFFSSCLELSALWTWNSRSRLGECAGPVSSGSDSLAVFFWFKGLIESLFPRASTMNWFWVLSPGVREYVGGIGPQYQHMIKHWTTYIAAHI